MTPHASLVLRRMHVAAIVLFMASIVFLALGQLRFAVAAIIPPFFIVIISLETLRVTRAKQEQR